MIQGFRVVTLASHVALPFLVILVTIGFRPLLSGTQGRFTWESFVANRLPLLKIPINILELVRAGSLAYTKAQIISRIRDQDLQSTLLQQTLEQNLSLGEIRKRIRNTTNVPLVEANIPQELLNQAYKRIKLSKAWEDPQKWKRVKELLQELSSLVGN